MDRSLPLPSSSAFSDSRLARQKANLSSLRGIATSRSLVSLRPSCMSWPFGVRQCFRIESLVVALILPFTSSVCFVPAAGMPPPSPYVAYADNIPQDDAPDTRRDLQGTFRPGPGTWTRREVGEDPAPRPGG